MGHTQRDLRCRAGYSHSRRQSAFGRYSEEVRSHHDKDSHGVELHENNGSRVAGKRIHMLGRRLRHSHEDSTHQPEAFRQYLHHADEYSRKKEADQLLQASSGVGEDA